MNEREPVTGQAQEKGVSDKTSGLESVRFTMFYVAVAVYVSNQALACCSANVANVIPSLRGAGDENVAPQGGVQLQQWTEQVNWCVFWARLLTYWCNKNCLLTWKTAGRRGSSLLRCPWRDTGTCNTDISFINMCSLGRRALNSPNSFCNRCKLQLYLQLFYVLFHADVKTKRINFHFPGSPAGVKGHSGDTVTIAVLKILLSS